MGCRGGSTHTNLFLRSADTDELCGEVSFLFGETNQCFPNNVGSCLVVEGASRSDTAIDELKFVIVGSDIADGHALEGFGFISDSNIDPHFVFLGDFLAILGSHEMNRPFTCNADDRSIGRLDNDAPTRDHDQVMPPNRIEVEKALFVDVGDDETELIEVTGEHQHGIPFGIQCRDSISERVLRVCISGTFNVSVKYGLCFRFISGRGFGLEQLAEKWRDLVVLHEEMIGERKVWFKSRQTDRGDQT